MPDLEVIVIEMEPDLAIAVLEETAVEAVTLNEGLKGDQGDPGADGTGGGGSGVHHGDGVPSDTFGLHGDHYLDRATGDVYRKEWKKPAQWAWAIADLRPEFQDIAALLLFLAPLWEGTGLPYDLISGVQATDPNPDPAPPSPTWTVKDGLICKDGATGGFWQWASPPLPAMNQPFSVLQVFQGAGFINLPKVNVENFADAKGGGLDPYYGTMPDAFQPANAYSGLYVDDDEPSRGLGWHATLVTLVSRGVAGAWAIDGASLSLPIDSSDDGTLLSETALGPTTYPLSVGSSDDVTATDPTWFQAMVGVSPDLTQEQAELVSGDPFGLIWPATDTSPRTTWIRVAQLATQDELDAEATARGAGDSALDTRLDAIEGLGSLATDAEVAAAVAAEAALRVTGDATNATAISAEATTRAGADTTETAARIAAVSAEATTRGNADTAEASARGSADTTLQANITAEAVARAAADALLAPLASPPLTGIPTAPTAALGTNTTQIATMAAIKAAIDALIDGAPGALDTLLEISNQLATDEGTVAALVTTVAGKQPLATNLTAFAALVGASDRAAYFTGAGSLSLYTLTTFGRTLAALADASALRTAGGLVIGTDVQGFHANLTALAGLTLIADRLPYANGSGTLALATFTAFGRTLAALTDAAAGRTALAVVPGTDVQAFHANLSAFAGLTLIADRLAYANGSGTLALATFTAAGRALVDDADAPAQRVTLGLGALAVLATVGAAQIDADAVTTVKILDANVTAAKLAATAVTPTSYGDATHVGQFTVDAQGRLTAAASVVITQPVPATASVLGTVKILGTPTDAANPTVMVNEQFPGQARLKVGATSYLTLPGVAFVGAITVLGNSANVVYYQPFRVGPRSLTLDSLVCEITTVGAAGKKCRMGVYKADADWQPLALVVQTAEFAADALAVITMGSLATALPPGRYLTAFTSDGAPNLRAYNGCLADGLLLLPTLGNSNPHVYRWSKTRTYAALPDPGVVADTILSSASAGFFTTLLSVTP